MDIVLWCREVLSCRRTWPTVNATEKRAGKRSGMLSFKSKVINGSKESFLVKCDCGRTCSALFSVCTQSCGFLCVMWTHSSHSSSVTGVAPALRRLLCGGPTCCLLACVLWFILSKGTTFPKVCVYALIFLASAILGLWLAEKHK